MARKRVRGAALMDVVVSVSLLFLVIFLVLNLFASSSMVLHHAQQRQAALEMARSRLEWLRGQPFSALKPGVETLPPLICQGVEFRGECILTPRHQGDILMAQCKIRWGSGPQRREVSYASYIAQRR